MPYPIADLEARLGDPHLLDAGAALPHDAQSLFERAITLLESGEVRAAQRQADGRWHAVPWVKRAILLGFRLGRGTMIDSHALVGSCAQIGERVHLSAAAQVGGVLEPVNASPVIIEDDVVVGGNCGVYEGTVVRARAVLGAGVILTRGTPVYDLVRETVLRATPEHPLEIPEGAVVVPGARRVASAFGEQEGLSLQTPVIVKYRDDRTDTATALEAWLR
jgi:2,3,4,5-tetrahydropyridine-2-carboxylate N-succinyltransferase